MLAGAAAKPTREMIVFDFGEADESCYDLCDRLDAVLREYIYHPTNLSRRAYARAGAHFCFPHDETGSTRLTIRPNGDVNRVIVRALLRSKGFEFVERDI